MVHVRREERIAHLFCAALEFASPQEQARFLDSHCSGRAKLRAKVDKRLTAHRTSGVFLGETEGESDEAQSAVTERPGCVVDRFELVSQLGEGGFGVVFPAVQRDPFTGSWR